MTRTKSLRLWYYTMFFLIGWALGVGTYAAKIAIKDFTSPHCTCVLGGHYDRNAPNFTAPEDCDVHGPVVP